MPNSQTFSGFYSLGSSIGASGTFSYGTFTPTVNTATDPDSNGETDTGTSIFWDATPFGDTLYGLTANGEPIVIGGGNYYILSDGGMSGIVTYSTSATFVYCFAAGTLIAREGGESAVEDLIIGDLVHAADGHLVPVKWIGRQTVHKLFSGPHMQPVRIRAGALGNGLPHSDLTVTADHGMVVDGLVINASALVNGSTIDWVPLSELPDRVTYYHVETEHHDVILANDAPAETFIDYAGRKAFDNYREYVDLHGCERIIPEMDRHRISAQRLVPQAIRDRLGIPAEPEFDWDDLDLWDDESAA